MISSSDMVWSGMPEVTTGRAVAVAVPVILLLLIGVFALSSFVVSLLGLPSMLAFPQGIRIAGGGLVVAGVAVGVWVFRCRSPMVIIVSTYITFKKLFTGVPMAEGSGRTEPLVVEGPQRYTRNPLYFGVVVVVFGYSIASGTTYALVGVLALLLWFCLVLIPFEERELRALFGASYIEYAEEVPMLVPFTKSRRH